MTRTRGAPALRDALPVPDWPKGRKLPGFAHGWEGAAWVLLQCGESTQPASFRRVIHGRLKKEVTAEQYTSLYIGSGARTVIAAMAAREDLAVRRLLPRIVKRWCRDVQAGKLPDVMLGTAGALLAAAEIENVAPGQVPAYEVRYMCARVREVVEAEWRSIRQGRRVCLGLAHGLAGYLLALESAQTVFGGALDRSLRSRLLETFRERCISGPWSTAVWPNFTGEDIPRINGWCNGGPGIGLAMLAGFALTGNVSYRELATPAIEGAARFSNALSNYCCGATGRAQILVEGSRILGRRRWLEQAKSIATSGPRSNTRSSSDRLGFHLGRLGTWYLHQRIQTPSLPLPGLGPLSVARSVLS